jgi:hypothetical protein
VPGRNGSGDGFLCTTPSGVGEAGPVGLRRTGEARPDEVPPGYPPAPGAPTVAYRCHRTWFAYSAATVGDPRCTSRFDPARPGLAGGVFMTARV